MEKKKVCFYVVCFLISSLVAMMLSVAVYNLSYYYVYGIDITHSIGLSEILMNSIIPWLLISALFFFLILIVIYFKYFHGPYEEYLRQKRAGQEKSKFAKWWDDFMNKWITGNNSNGEASERRKIRREKLRALHYHSISDFFFFAIILVICYFAFKNMIEMKDDMEFCLLVGLMLPVLFFFGLNILVVSFKPDRFLRRFKKPFFFIIEMVFPYLVYAMMISYMAGDKRGINNKVNPQMAFEIKTQDGQQYNNAEYGFVGQVSDELFLFEKNSDMIVSISKSDCYYFKSSANPDLSKTTVRRFHDVMQNEQ